MIDIHPWPPVGIASSRTTWTVMACDAAGEVIRVRHDITSEDTAAAEFEAMTAIPGVVKVAIVHGSCWPLPGGRRP